MKYELICLGRVTGDDGDYTFEWKRVELEATTHGDAVNEGRMAAVCVDPESCYLLEFVIVEVIEIVDREEPAFKAALQAKYDALARLRKEEEEIAERRRYEYLKTKFEVVAGAKPNGDPK